MARITKKITDFAIVARTFYKNIPDSNLKRSCERHKIPLVFCGAGEGMPMYSYVMYRTLEYLKILPFKKVLVCDYTDTIVCGTVDDFYERLPDGGVLWSTDYQKLPYCNKTDENPIWPAHPPEFIDCFVDKETKLVYAPNGGAYGGNRLEVIKALTRCLDYATQFCMIEEPGYMDATFPFVAELQRKLDGTLVRDDQHLACLLFYDKWRHEQEGKTFPVNIERDCDKRVFTSCQEGYPDGDAIFYHFPGFGMNNDFCKQKMETLAR